MKVYVYWNVYIYWNIAFPRIVWEKHFCEPEFQGYNLFSELKGVFTILRSICDGVFRENS